MSVYELPFELDLSVKIDWFLVSILSNELRANGIKGIITACNQYNIYGFLSIDAHEHDVNVLNSLDLKKYQPILIILELGNFSLMSVSEIDIFTYLQQFDYRLVGYVLRNAYF